MNNYIICTAARSGKSWIAETLYWLNLGYALELLTEFTRGTAPGQDRLRTAYEREGMAGLANTFIEVDGEKGYPCVGVTLQWTNLDMIDAANRANELLAFIKTLQPCTLFFLRRRDTVSQAISHFIMMKSGYYHSTDFEGGKGRRNDVRYDRAEIDSYLDFTENSYLGWQDIFIEAGINPMTLYYEDFINDPIGNFKSLTKCIAGTDISDVDIAAAADCQSKVSDSIDETFRMRYMNGE